jgi:hypothetical protein
MLSRRSLNFGGCQIGIKIEKHCEEQAHENQLLPYSQLTLLFSLLSLRVILPRLLGLIRVVKVSYEHLSHEFLGLGRVVDVLKLRGSIHGCILEQYLIATGMLEVGHVVDLVVNKEPEVSRFVVIGYVLELGELASLFEFTNEVALHLLAMSLVVACVIKDLCAVLGARVFLDDIGTTRMVPIELGEIIDLPLVQDPDVVLLIVKFQLFHRDLFKLSLGLSRLFFSSHWSIINND